VKPSSEEVGSRQFWVNPAREVARSATRLQNTKPKEAGWLKKLAAQATAVWWTHRTRDPEAEASRLAQAVAGSSQYLVAVIQALPKRDCMAYETPGLDPEAYRGFIQSLKRGMGETAIYWILEPEALLLTACSKPEEHEARVRLIAETVLVLKTNPKAQVYLDIGYPGWLSVDDAVQRLLQAGVMAADGFALNVGHYQWTEDCLAYGQSISQKIGGKSFVIDTSRNGKGPGARGNWCNPKNRAIGELPMAPTGIKGLDAYLWLKEPGVSDGSCNGGPAAGQWSEAKAIELMRNAEQTEH
jgi:endoglucanase